MKLHDYQKRIARFCYDTPQAILSVGMGLGKTASVLTYLQYTNPRSVLIVAPKRVAETVWKQEAEKWGYACAQRMEIIHGTAAQRERQWKSDKPWKVVGRDNLQDWVKWGGSYDVLVLDELTSFKSITSQRSKIVCKISANRKIGLTGTFLANGAIDIYGQAAAVGIKLNNANFYAWRATHFRDVLQGSGLQFQKWKLTDTLDGVLAPIRQNIFTLSSEDYLQIPPVTERVHSVVLSQEERKAYDALQSFLAFEIGGETMTFDEQQKFCKLQQLCNGFVYSDDGQTIEGQLTKCREVVEFCERCKGEGESVLLFYAYQAERNALVRMLRAAGLTVADAKETASIGKWNAKEVDVLIAHPASAGHGLNLQAGGHIIAWSSVTYNYELFAQANARLARQGQTEKVQIHYFVAQGTIEEQQMRALRKKDNEQQRFIKTTKQ